MHQPQQRYTTKQEHIAMCCLARSILMTEDRRSLTRTPRLSTRFCPVSFACWTHSATGMPVHCLISSVQRLRGLPRRLFPATMPCRTYEQRLSAQTTRPKYCSFLLLTSATKRRAGSNSSNIELLVLCSVQLILIILLYMSISNAFSLLWSAALIVQDSQPYVAKDQTKVCMSLLFNCRFKEWSFHRLVNDLAVDLAMPSLAAICVLQSYVSVMMLPR